MVLSLNDSVQLFYRKLVQIIKYLNVIFNNTFNNNVYFFLLRLYNLTIIPDDQCIKETVIPTYVHNEIIQWIISLIQKSINTKIHIFCLDFASATLANVIHTPYTLQYLEKQSRFTHQIMEQLLKFIKEQIQVSVMMHILICLSYLSKENFAKQMEECRFVERISEFVEYYSVINTENEAAEIDKKTILDLCAHMFHPKDTSLDNSETLELNELKTEDRIREYENEQGELIFECFQDEVS